MSNLMEKRMSNKHVEPDPDEENMSSLIPECKKTSPRELKNHKKMVMRGNMDGSYQRHQKNTIHGSFCCYNYVLMSYFYVLEYIFSS